MKNDDPKEIYSALEKVWPDHNRWYDHTHQIIIKFIEDNLISILNNDSLYLNAGSGGSTYNLPGNCYHVDIAENLIKTLPNYYVASIEKLPFPNNTFDASICVGSVINYCSAIESLTELIRTLKPNGYLILEFERSNTAELWFTKDYGKQATMQKYEYLNHIHTLWLYAEKYIKEILNQHNMCIKKYKRFHNLSALSNRITHKEEMSGKFGKYDTFFTPISGFMAHNVIMLCVKQN